MLNLVGQQLGNYRLVAQIGRGGYAEVYLGEHRYLETQAAIKVLHARLTENTDVEQFHNEARMIARLVHPHIVRVYDFDIEDDVPYLVMDYAPNGTLRRRHPKGVRLSLKVILPYVQQLADALQYAHNHRLVHRDVKPENMLLGRNSEILLGDFGTALVAQTIDPEGAQPGMIAGTVAYMSPEQFEGRAYPSSDQYALAIVVYEWLTGKTPFRGSVTDVAIQHASKPPPPLRDALSTIPEAVEKVVMKALAKDPAQRFPSIRDFAAALEQAVTMGTVSYDDETPAIVAPEEASEELTFTPMLLAQSARISNLPRPVVSVKQVGSITPVAAARDRQPLLVRFLLLAMVALLCGSASWLAFDYLPGLHTPHVVESQAPIFPGVAGSYLGAINDTAGKITTSLALAIQQSQGEIGGAITVGSRMIGSGPFTGVITPGRQIQFTVQGYQANPPLLFYGALQRDGSLAGSYCSLDKEALCDARAGSHGTWKVVRQSNVTSKSTPTATKTTPPKHTSTHSSSSYVPPPPTGKNTYREHHHHHHH